MSWTDDLLDGLADRAATLGLGTWNPDEMTGSIVTGSLPDDVTNGVGILGYNLQPDPTLADVVQPVQFWLRGDAAFVNDAADRLFDGLHGSTNQTVGGIACPLIALHSDVPHGPDQRGRIERSLNYDIHAMRPTASRPD